MKKLSFLLLIISSYSLACNPVLPIKKGEPSKCDGFVFSKEKERELAENRIKLVEIENLFKIKEQEVVILNKEIDFTEKQVNIWKVQSNLLAEENTKLRSNRFWYYFGYFALGVVMTTGITYAVNQ